MGNKGIIKLMKIQITVDESLGKQIQTQANQLGLSVSSYARCMLKNSIKKTKLSLLDKALEEKSENTTLEDFQKEIDTLKNA